MWQGFYTLKFKFALAFAIVSAIVVAVAGYSSSARLPVVLLRSCIGFLCVDVLVYLIAMLLENRGLVDFEGNMVLAEDDDFEAGTGFEAAGMPKEEGTGEAEGADAVGEGPSEAGNQTGFKPLSGDNLQHVSASASE